MINDLYRYLGLDSTIYILSFFVAVIGAFAAIMMIKNKRTKAIMLVALLVFVVIVIYITINFINDKKQAEKNTSTQGQTIQPSPSPQLSEYPRVDGLPEVATFEATDISDTSVTLNGGIIESGGEQINEYGFYISRSPGGPWVIINVAKNDKTGSISTEFAGLSPETTYYFYAYASNSAGKGTGKTKSFTTEKPTITEDPFHYKKVTVRVNGIIIYDKNGLNNAVDSPKSDDITVSITSNGETTISVGAQGPFIFEDVNKYDALSVEAPNYQTIETTIYGDDNNIEYIRSADELEIICNLIPKNMISVYGKIYLDSHTPLVNTIIEISPLIEKPNDETSNYKTTTDRYGYFRFDDLYFIKGEYMLTANDPENPDKLYMGRLVVNSDKILNLNYDTSYGFKSVMTSELDLDDVIIK